MTLLTIESQNDVPSEILLKGTNRNTDIGILIHVSDGDTITLPRVEISNVFIGFIKTGNGKLVFSDGYIIDGFGGDAFNYRGSNFYFINDGVLETYNSTPTRPYNKLKRKGKETVSECLERNNETVYDYSLLEFKDGYIEGYHCDAIGQFYAVKEDGYTLDSNGTIENINIPRIRARHSNSNVQGLSCTEICEYKNFKLGTELLDINMGYIYPFLFNQLSYSKIGNRKARFSGKIRVSDVKQTNFKSKNNVFIGIDVDGYKMKDNLDTNYKEIFQPQDKLGGELTLGYKNNNAGNITASNSQWKGLVTGDDIKGSLRKANGLKYCIFSHPVYGVRALCVDLRNKQVRRKLKSVRAIMNRYAPSGKDNPHQSKYIMFICSQVGCSPTQIINLSDRDTMRSFITAIILFENGVQNPIPYSDEMIEDAMTLAGILESGESANKKPLHESKTIQASTGAIGTVATGTATVIATKEKVPEPVNEIIKKGILDNFTNFELIIMGMSGAVILLLVYIIYDRYLMKRLGVK